MRRTGRPARRLRHTHGRVRHPPTLEGRVFLTATEHSRRRNSDYGVITRTQAKLRAAAEEHMATLGREPERVKAYFRDPQVRYAS